MKECKFSCGRYVKDDEKMCNVCKQVLKEDFIDTMKKYNDLEIEQIDELLDGKYLSELIKEKK